MSEVKNVLITGVGGQGTILAAKVLSRILMKKDYDIKVSEIHGMSQRGGSVVTQVRYGEKVYAPIIEEGRADIIIAFEKMEALRLLPYLKEGGAVIANDQRIDPMPVIMGITEYPNDIEGYFAQKGVTAHMFDALAIAKGAGSVKAVNMVLLGAWAALSSFNLEESLEVVAENVPPKFLEVNRAAFTEGYRLLRK